MAEEWQRRSGELKSALISAEETLRVLREMGLRLDAVSHDRTESLRAFESGIPATLFDAMRRFAADADIQSACLYAIHRISRECHGRFAVFGPWDEVFRAMEAFPDSSDVCKNGCWAIGMSLFFMLC